MSTLRSRRSLPCLVHVSLALLAACGVDSRPVGTLSQGGTDSAGSGGSAGESAAGAGGAGLGGAGLGGASAGGSGGGAAGSAPEAGSGGAGEDAGSSGSGGAPDAGEPEPELPSCATRRLSGLGTATATTTSAPGSVSLSCGAGTSDDVSFFWVAPAAGYYSIDTFGSSFDTTLGVLSADCDGSELACADESDQPPASEIVREFGAGEGVVLVVDGKSGSFGEVSLSTHAITCPGIDLNQQQPPLDSTTLDGTNEHSGACGGDGRREKAYRYTAPSAGLYRFTASSDTIGPALYLERGPRCGGPLLGCNAGGAASPATVVRELAAGEVVTLIVDGTEDDGSFELNVEDISENLCPSDGELDPFGGETTGVLSAGDPSVLTGSCAPARQSVLPGGVYDLPEHSYSITVEGASCRILLAADGDLAVYVLEGNSCGGAELSCQNVPANTDGDVLEPPLGELTGGPLEYVITIEATNPNGGDVSYTLDFLCAII